MDSLNASQKRHNTQQNIIGKASVLFRQKGYETTSLNEILKEAGVSKSSFYLNFASKEELGIEYLTRRQKSSLEVIKTLMERKTDSISKATVVFNYAKTLFNDDISLGCPFISTYMGTSSTTLSDEMSSIVASYKTALQGCISDALESHFAHSGTAGRGHKASRQAIATAIYLLYEGGIVASTIHKDTSYIDVAKDTATELLYACATPRNTATTGQQGRTR